MKNGKKQKTMVFSIQGKYIHNRCENWTLKIDRIRKFQVTQSSMQQNILGKIQKDRKIIERHYSGQDARREGQISDGTQK